MEFVGVVEEAEERKPPKIRLKDGGEQYLRSRSSEFFEEGDPVFKDVHGIHRTYAECERCDGEMLPGDEYVICPHCDYRMEFADWEV